MKKIFVVFLFGLCCLQSHAYEPEVTIGTRHGASASMVWFYPEINTKYLWGYTGGVYSRMIFEKYFGLQIELNYMQRGWDENYSKLFVYNRRFHYIELPFITHFFLGKKNFRWFFNAGLNLSAMLGQKITSTATTEQSVNLPEHDLNVSNKFDYGICAGTGIEFHTKAGIYQMEFRYNFGLGDVFPNKLADDFSRSSNHNMTLCFGILFDVKKDKYKKH